MMNLITFLLICFGLLSGKEAKALEKDLKAVTFTLVKTDSLNEYLFFQTELDTIPIQKIRVLYQDTAVELRKLNSNTFQLPHGLEDKVSETLQLITAQDTLNFSAVLEYDYPIARIQYTSAPSSSTCIHEYRFTGCPIYIMIPNAECQPVAFIQYFRFDPHQPRN